MGQDENTTFLNRQGLPLFQRQWPARAPAKGNIVIIHGYGEHCGRYADKAAVLNEHGYSVYSFDLTGYGRSPGKPAFISSFDRYLDDVDACLESLASTLSGSPLFLMGQSMGGLIASLYAATRQCPDVRGVPRPRGLVLCSPSLRISDDVSPILQRLSGIVGALLPTLPVLPLETAALSRDPAVVKDYENDPLVYHGKIRARTGAEIMRAVGKIQREMDAIRLPLLILHGTADRLCDPRGSRDLYARAQSTDKTLKIYEGGYHELFNDLEKDAVMAEITSWLDRHL